MKLLLALVLCFGFTAEIASAAPVQAVGYRKIYAAGTYNTTNWNVILPQSVKSIKAISVLNTGASPIEIGLAVASAATDTEVSQMIAPAGNGVSPNSLATTVLFPLSASQGQRLSIRALNSALTSGELQFNVFYN